MASRASAIITELLTALRVNHATVDLRTTSDTPRVLCPAMVLLPPSAAPLLVISAPQVTPSYETAIGQYRNAGTFEWALFVASTAEDPSVRALAALEAAHDVISAVEAAHATSSNTTLFGLVELLMTLDDVTGEDLEDAPGFGVAIGRLTYVDQPATRGI